jgi:NADPH:quinone reductase-like Zn-dependent oxidoreductase
MTEITELWTNRADLRETKTVTRSAPELREGEVLMKIEKVGLTANNVSYAVTGDSIGYWGYFPADETWGKVPAWGFAHVVDSNCAEIESGERVWGFFPLASHVVLRPGKVKPARFVDTAEHRAALPPMYNGYMRTGPEPEILSQFEDERCILFPLFATSYILYDFLIDNDFFGADQVLIGSASSKTGFGLAHLLFNDKSLDKRVVGLTSTGNAVFCEKLGCFDEITVYGTENELDPSTKSVFVDMSSDRPLTVRIHEHFTDNLLATWVVGATHWEDGGKPPAGLPGAKPTFFFAPTHMGKRDKEWGPGKFWEKAFTASIEVTQDTASTLVIVAQCGADAAAASWLGLLDNKVPGSTGLIVSI